MIEKVTSDSSYFYTLSYSPTNAKMDGRFRNLDVQVAGGKHSLSYRRGYFAVDTALPGSSMTVRNQEIQKLAVQIPGAVDPLLPFMDLGMPQSQQILYKVRIFQVAAADSEPADKKDKIHYKVDFAIDLKYLNLLLDADGLHKGALNFSLIVYDRDGNIGIQLHAELTVAKGNHWLRTRVYDQGSHKVGTMEVALSSMVPLQASTK